MRKLELIAVLNTKYKTWKWNPCHCRLTLKQFPFSLSHQLQDKL